MVQLLLCEGQESNNLTSCSMICSPQTMVRNLRLSGVPLAPALWLLKANQ